MSMTNNVNQSNDNEKAVFVSENLSESYSGRVIVLGYAGVRLLFFANGSHAAAVPRESIRYACGLGCGWAGWGGGAGQ